MPMTSSGLDSTQTANSVWLKGLRRLGVLPLKVAGTVRTKNAFLKLTFVCLNA
jgi:hypothetical protein